MGIIQFTVNISVVKAHQTHALYNKTHQTHALYKTHQTHALYNKAHQIHALYNTKYCLNLQAEAISTTVDIMCIKMPPN